MTEQSLKIELAPMSTGTFLALVIVPLIWIAIAVVFFGWGLWVRDETAVCAGAIDVPILLIAGALLFRFGLYRNEPRTVWASPDRLGYRDARSGAIPVLTDPRLVYPPVRVVRSWRRPWVFLLAAEKPILGLIVRRSHSVVLAIDTDLAMLESLVPLIEAARVPIETGHVRGAFEVIASTPDSSRQTLESSRPLNPSPAPAPR